jgi:phosphopantetheinyl transferase
MIHLAASPFNTPSDLKPAIFKLLLQRKSGLYTAYLGFSTINLSHLQATREEFLHQAELEEYHRFESERKKDSFLHGRFVAKKVLSSYLKEATLASIRIKPGVFNQPLVVYNAAHTPMVSIAHTGMYAASLAFSDEHPMAFDMELITPNAREHVRSQLTTLEHTLNITLQEENMFYTRIWTIKEALSKVLKTGMMTPMDIYQVDAIDQELYKDFTVSTFTYFSQYKALSFPWKNTICSIVLPKETNITAILTSDELFH